jgi:glutamate synthase domain-containing protein 2
MLHADYFALGNWRLVAEKYDLPKGTIHDVGVKMREPRKPTIRKKLGYALTAEVEICPIHGIVHVNTCPEVVKTRRTKFFKDLMAMPEGVLKWKMINREDL